MRQHILRFVLLQPVMLYKHPDVFRQCMITHRVPISERFIIHNIPFWLFLNYISCKDGNNLE
jgi:hypothetical protein